MLLDPSEFFTSPDPTEKTRYYVGTVVNDNDPKKLGRVKVSIPEIYGEADTDKLPWVSSIGNPKTFKTPNMGSKLIIFFPFGMAYFPFSLGYWHFTSTHSTYFDADYPNTFGIDDSFKVKFNKVDKSFELLNPDGAYFKIKPDGGLEFNALMVCKFITGDNFEIESTKKIKLTSTEDTEINSSQKVKIDGTGGLEFTTDGEAKFKGTAKTEVGDSGSITMVNGQTVLIAGGGTSVAVLGATCIGVGNLGIPVMSTIIQGSSKVFAPL